jgi:phosphoribosylglycinamide formyltransferase-1
MAKKRVAVLISGSGSNLQALLDAATQSDFPAEIALVISNKADAYGLTRATNAGVATTVIPHGDYPSREAFEAAIQAMLEKAGIEFICLAGFMRILSASFVEQWQGHMLNIHPSLLPAFPGLHTHARAIESGARFAGCTVHFVVPEMDAGPIVVQAAVSILDGDDEAALATRVLAEEHRIYPTALRWLAEGKLQIIGNRVIVETHAATSTSLIQPE